MSKSKVENIVLGTMTMGYGGYGIRVNSVALVGEMLDCFERHGHRSLDTSLAYGDSSCERMLGDLGAGSRFKIAIRFHPGDYKGHEPSVLEASVTASMARLHILSADILYLAMRDYATPIESTLQKVNELYSRGHFAQFGISNFSAWEVAQVCEICISNDWVRPTVYEGLYNAVSRVVEAELFDCLRHYGMRFHAYNPLAGGAFAPGFGADRKVKAGSRFDDSHPQGRFYRRRYWNDSYIEAMHDFQARCAGEGVDPVAAALRWLVHHSYLDGVAEDGVIIGASSLTHLEHNLAAVEDVPLPESIVDALDEASRATRSSWPSYFARV